MKVLLSIKPEFVEKILDGTKKYEYRKSMFKRKDISTVVIYASYPVKKVVGEFRIKRIGIIYFELVNSVFIGLCNTQIYKKLHQIAGYWIEV